MPFTELKNLSLSLTQITRKIDNIIADKLLTISMPTYIGDMPLSLKTHKLITTRNHITCLLRRSLKADRKAYRANLKDPSETPF